MSKNLTSICITIQYYNMKTYATDDAILAKSMFRFSRKEFLKPKNRFSRQKKPISSPTLESLNQFAPVNQCLI